MNKNHAFLNSFLNVPEETFNKFRSISIFKEIEARVPITKSGEIPTKVYMLTTGLIRAYMSSECGREHNKNIFSPYSFAGALTALIKKKPSELTYETLTPCKGYEINFSAMKELCRSDIIVSNLYNKILESIFIAYEQKQLELIVLHATQRYLNLKIEIPDIEDLIPQYEIASYLNITPVQLSRIRKKMKFAEAY
jgi:CRP-like cAMP-binding protein